MIAVRMRRTSSETETEPEIEVGTGKGTGRRTNVERVIADLEATVTLVDGVRAAEVILENAGTSGKLLNGTEETILPFAFHYMYFNDRDLMEDQLMSQHL